MNNGNKKTKLNSLVFGKNLLDTLKSKLSVLNINFQVNSFGANQENDEEDVYYHKYESQTESSSEESNVNKDLDDSKLATDSAQTNTDSNGHENLDLYKFAQEFVGKDLFSSAPNNSEKVNSVNNENNGDTVYLSTEDLTDIYKHAVIGPDEKVYLTDKMIQKYKIDAPNVKFVDVNNEKIPVQKFLDNVVSSNKKMQVQEMNNRLNETPNSNEKSDQQIENETPVVLVNDSSEVKQPELESKSDKKEPIHHEEKAANLNDDIAPVHTNSSFKSLDLYKYVMDNYINSPITLAHEIQHFDKHGKPIIIVNRKIEDGVLYLGVDDLIDIYKHSVIGPDENVYLKRSMLHKYKVDDPSVKFVDINNDKFPVEKLLSIMVSDNHKQQIKEIYEKMKLSSGTVENKQVPNILQNNIEKIQPVQQIETKETDQTVTPKEVLVSPNVEADYQEANVAVDQIAKDAPIQQIDDSIVALDHKFGSSSETPVAKKPEIKPAPAPEISTIQPLPKVKTEVKEEVAQPVVMDFEKQPIVSSTKQNNVLTLDNNDTNLPVVETYKNEDDYKKTRVNDIAKNSYVNSHESTLAENSQALMPSKEQPTQFIYISSAPEKKLVDVKQSYGDIPVSNDKEYTANLYEGIKQEEANDVYNAIKAEAGKVITISDLGLENEFNKFLVDPRRKIYIIDEDRALKSFGIINDSKLDQKVLTEGNVLHVHSGEYDSLLSAPYGTLEDNYIDDNVFFLPNEFSVAVLRNIEPTMINMNNFQVEVAHVAFRLPKNEKMVYVRNSDVNDYVENVKEYLVNETNEQLDTFYEKNQIYLSAAISHEIGLTLDDKKINNNIDKLSISKQGVNEKVNIIKLFNVFYNEFLDPLKNRNRRIIKFYKMIRQILMDGTYYAESRLLVLNYAEMLVFLVEYFNVNLANVFEVRENNVNKLLVNTIKTNLDNKLTYVDDGKKYNGYSYFIPEEYTYVLYKDNLLNIRTDYVVDTTEVDYRLLARPTFSDIELCDMSSKNYERLRIISPYIDFVAYYDSKKDEILNKIQNSGSPSLSKQDKDKTSPKVHTEVNKKEELSKQENDGIVQLNDAQVQSLYAKSHVSEDGVIYVDQAEAKKLNLNNPNIKAVKVNEQIIPVSSITKKEMDEEIKGKDFIKANDDTKANKKSIPEPNKDKVETKEPDIKTQEPSQTTKPESVVKKPEDTNDTGTIVKKEETPKNKIEQLEKKLKDKKAKAIEVSSTMTKDGKVINLTISQMNDINAEAKVSGDKVAYLSPKLANKYGLMDNDVIGVNVEGTFIPLEKLKKHDYKKEKK